ncbi:P-loop containing nucleoside triphosphate hydrolase protein, partial [Blastocladiella britannica]
PQVILADEPSAGLDPATRMGVWKLLGRIREQGETVILVTTHSMAEADALCTRIGIMAGGRMRVLGNPVSLRK